MPVSLVLAAALVVAVGGQPDRQFDLAALDALPQAAARFTGHGQSLDCTGPALASVLAATGLPSGSAMRGTALRKGVLARGADGYAVLFSLGELDPLLGNARVIVATRCDGRPIDADNGPLRIIADGEARGARSVRNLVRIEADLAPAD
jgi:hypothetical protein